MNKMYAFLVPIVRVLMALLFPSRVKGLEHLPEGPVVLCGNHTCFLDPVYVVCAANKRCQFRIVAKAELSRVPVLGWLLRKIGVISIKRGMADIGAVKECLRVLRNGEKLLIFPEGTRVKEGQTVQAHTGAVVMAARAGVPLMPVYISPKKRIFRKADVIFGQPYTPETGGRKPTPEESQAITNDLMARVWALGESV